MMNALIIDDEKKARQVLKILINENCPKVDEIFEASNLMDGIAIIKAKAPNIVFLDIEMPEHSGLEILQFIEKEVYNFEIIFTTAYSEYAIQAFHLAAVDYLLKPVRANQIKTAVEKAIKLMGNSQLSKRIAELKNSLLESNFKKIGLPIDNGIKFVNFSDIVLFKSKDNSSLVLLSNGELILVKKTIKYFSEVLNNMHVFFRPNEIYIVNLSYIKEYIKSDGGYIVIDNNETISIAKEKRNEFLSIVKSL